MKWRLLKNTLVLGAIWIIIVLLSYVIGGCATKNDFRKVDFRIDYVEYTNNFHLCNVDYRLCLLSANSFCKFKQEKCVIQNNNIYKKNNKRKANDTYRQ